MTLKECYTLLGVSQSATLEEVKRGYRKRAFEWHPDLNPQLGDAGRRFQQLNEAYVILTKLIAARETRDERLRAEQQAKDNRKKAAEAAQKAAREAKAASAATAGEQAAASEAQREHSQTNTGFTATGSSQSAKTAGTAGAGSAEAGSATSESTADSASGTTDHATTGKKGAHSASTGQHRQTTADSAGEKVYAEQQEVLRDILNDPFARRVFEDIYSAIRQKGADTHKEPPQPEAPRQGFSLFGFGGDKKASPKAGSPTAGAPTTQAGRAGAQAVEKPEAFWESMLGLGRKHTGADSKGVGGAVKGWLRGQIDEEQTFLFPAAKLFPGARIRLQIRRGLSDDVTVLEVTLPPDFVVGKPIRLKGMGKKVGNWQGDLYLTLLARSA